MRKKYFENNFLRRIKNSIYTRPIFPDKESDKIQVALQSFIFHLHPPVISDKALKLSVTLGLGGMAALLVVLQAVTGLLLRFVYYPIPEKAYASIIYLQDELFFGELIRNIHYWSGMFLIVIALLHLLRVYFTGAYHEKRRFNWVIGVSLFFLILLSNFTGYLLPWDQLAYWAITVGTNILSYIPFFGEGFVKLIRGGAEVGAPTLLIFYTLHTGILPFAIMVLMGFHFWRVRKAGGVAIAKEDESNNTKVTTIPNLVLRELVAAIILLAVILLISVLFNAPLLDKANPDFSPNPTKAPWYFGGFQELMLHFHPLIAAIVIPVLVMFFLLSIPYFEYDRKTVGVWFLSTKGRLVAKISIIVALVVTPVFIIVDEYIIKTSQDYFSTKALMNNGVISSVFLLGCTLLYYFFLKRKYKTNKEETIQALFVLLLVIFIILSITNVFFRGEEMLLSLPWN